MRIFSALANISEYGTSGLFIAGLFGFLLYHISKAIYEGYKGNNTTNSHSSSRGSYSSRTTYTGREASGDDDDLEDLIMPDMMDGKLDGEFNFFDKD